MDITQGILNEEQLTIMHKRIHQFLGQHEIRENLIAELSDFIEQFRSLKIIVIGQSKSGKSTLVKAITENTIIKTGCDGEATTKKSEEFAKANSRLTVVDTIGIELFEKDKGKLNEWWKSNVSCHSPHIAFLLTARNVRCSRGVYRSILKRLLSGNILTFYLITDCIRLTDDELKIKEREREQICNNTLKSLTKLPLPPKKDSGIITFYEGILYGANINSTPFTLRNHQFPVEGLREVLQTISSHLVAPRIIALAILSYAKETPVNQKFINWFREMWVEISRDSKKESYAFNTFGKRGGDFFMYCIRRLQHYEALLNAHDVMAENFLVYSQRDDL
jgi:energy-coupling factor transporter ATP-binding protein EcfA2